jgi:hypothetical protein
MEKKEMYNKLSDLGDFGYILSEIKVALNRTTHDKIPDTIAVEIRPDIKDEIFDGVIEALEGEGFKVTRTWHRRPCYLNIEYK